MSSKAANRPTINENSLTIAHFSEVARPLVNGVVLAIENLSNFQREAGHQAFWYAPALGNLTPGWQLDHFQLRSLPLPTSTGYRLTLPHWLQGSLGGQLGSVNVFHAHSIFSTGVIAQAEARRRKIPCVYTYHTRLEHYIHYAPLGARWIQKLLDARLRIFAEGLDLIITPTNAVAESLRAMNISAPIRVAPSGIALGAFSVVADRRLLRAQLGIAEDDVMLLCVARLAREKNLEVLLQMMARLNSSYHLVLVGHGPEKAHLEALTATMQISGRVHFCGAIAPESVPAYYGAANAFVFASVSETQGLVLCEALASGLPVIAVDTAVTREVTYGSDVVLVAHDASALSQGVKKVLADASSSFEKVATRRNVARRFDERTCALHIEELYREMITANTERGKRAMEGHV